MSSEADLHALHQRIAIVRKEIDALRVERAPRRAEKRRAAIKELEEKVRAARERLRSANAQQTTSPDTQPTREQTLRGGLTWVGGLITAVGLVVLYVAYATGVFVEGELWDRIEIGLVFSIPFAVGVALLARARFAKYRADKQELEGDIADLF